VLLELDGQLAAASCRGSHRHSSRLCLEVFFYYFCCFIFFFEEARFFSFFSLVISLFLLRIYYTNKNLINNSYIINNKSKLLKLNIININKNLSKMIFFFFLFFFNYQLTFISLCLFSAMQTLNLRVKPTKFLINPYKTNQPQPLF
jgi:hypothetical protein